MGRKPREEEEKASPFSFDSTTTTTTSFLQGEAQEASCYHGLEDSVAPPRPFPPPIRFQVDRDSSPQKRSKRLRTCCPRRAPARVRRRAWRLVIPATRRRGLGFLSFLAVLLSTWHQQFLFWRPMVVGPTFLPDQAPPPGHLRSAREPEDVIDQRHHQYHNHHHLLEGKETQWRSSTPICWLHDPLVLANSLNNHSASHQPPAADDLREDQEEDHDVLVWQQPTVECGQIRRRHWVHQPRPARKLSPWAQHIQQHQRNCSLPRAIYVLDQSYGMGAHFYLYSQALCNAIEIQHRLHLVTEEDSPWLWSDQAYCGSSSTSTDSHHPFGCYLPATTGDVQACRAADHHHHFMMMNNHSTLAVPDPRQNNLRCRRMREEPGFLATFRRATLEVLFQQVSPLVLREAQRQVGLLFMPDGREGDDKTGRSRKPKQAAVPRAPPDLITVHMRWGDKFWEMDLPPVEEYVDAVSRILQQRGAAASLSQSSNQSTPVAHVYLATEDPRAVEAFAQAAPPSWKIYVDRTVVELNAFRPTRGNRASWTARHTQGRAGLVALGSLLVALEADSFVLTTQSNWSRLINELRRIVVDPECGNCSLVIDLRPGQW